MLCLIRIHCRPVPALKIGKFYIVGADGLRTRGIYVYRQALDHAGMPCLGQQVCRVLLSHDWGRVQLNISAPWNFSGYTFRLPGVTWGFAYPIRKIGGLVLYRIYQRTVIAWLSPDRREHSICPRWDVCDRSTV